MICYFVVFGFVTVVQHAIDTTIVILLTSTLQLVNVFHNDCFGKF